MPILPKVKIFLHTQDNPFLSHTPISNNTSTPSRIHYTIKIGIIYVLKNEAARAGTTRLGFAPEGTGMNSFCSGTSIYMYVMGVYNYTIWTFGSGAY